ncbi:MAG: S8 family serine peptidase, partial [Blastocatellia bacterium]|nr:S8 family serine peptidase [Blastocatellia bacterium]
MGDPRICIAILDGPVDRSHPGLATANLTTLDTLVPGIADQGVAAKHGTHVASILFGQHGGPIPGIAPRCRGLSIPIFKDGPDNSLTPCSQLDLARAISQAVQEGAHIINISGGESSSSGTAHPILADAVGNCAAHGVLVVAAAGNEGCDCLHVPGGLPSVLAVGAMDLQGEPLGFSNWGEGYQVQGILAPGENILGASPGNGIVANSGTSYATAIVSGIAALLLSLQLKQGGRPDPHAVRAALLSSAVGCDDLPATDCRRLLAGRLNVEGAMSQIIRGVSIMTDSTERPENVRAHAAADADSQVPVAHTPGAGIRAATSESESSSASEYRQPPPVNSEVASNAPENPLERDAALPSHANTPACSCGGSGACTCGGSILRAGQNESFSRG